MSTTVIVEGDADLVTRDRRFVCPFCGEVFITDSETYTLATNAQRAELGAEAFATCPECSQEAMSPTGPAGIPATPVALTLLSLPTKQIYRPGEKFVTTGLKLGMEMSDGSVGAVALEDCTFSPDTDTALDTSDKVVTVTHTATDEEIDVPIAVRNAYLAYPIVTNTEFVYNGSSQGPTIVGFDSDTMTKSNDTKTSAGSYTLSITPKTGYCWPDASTSSLTWAWVIAKAVPVVTPPVRKTGLVYSGEAQALLTAGTTSGGTMKYKLGAGDWGNSVPTATNAGSYTIKWKVDGGTNYEDNPGGECIAVISTANPVITEPAPIENLVYTGEEQELITAAVVADECPVKYTSHGAWVETVPTGVNAQNYVVVWAVSAAGHPNYHPVQGTLPVITIAKADPAITLSADTLTLTAIATPGTSTVTIDVYDGTVTVASSDEEVCTAEISEGTVTVTAVANGTATVTVNAPATSNCNAASATIAVTVALE